MYQRKARPKALRWQMHSGGHPQRRPAGLWSRPTMPIRRVYAPKLSHVCQGGHVLLLQMSHGFTWKRDSMSRFGPQQRGTLLRGALGSTSCSWPLGSSDLPTHKRREPQARAVVEARPPAFDQPRATPERHRLRRRTPHLHHESPNDRAGRPNGRRGSARGCRPRHRSCLGAGTKRQSPAHIPSFAIPTTLHPALIPQEAAGSSRQYPPIPAMPGSESPALVGNPR
jgi:hypothetical protein